MFLPFLSSNSSVICFINELHRVWLHVLLRYGKAFSFAASSESARNSLQTPALFVQSWSVWTARSLHKLCWVEARINTSFDAEMIICAVLSHSHTIISRLLTKFKLSVTHNQVSRGRFFSFGLLQLCCCLLWLSYQCRSGRITHISHSTQTKHSLCFSLHEKWQN